MQHPFNDKIIIASYGAFVNYFALYVLHNNIYGLPNNVNRYFELFTETL